MKWILLLGFIAFIIIKFFKKKFNLEKGAISQYVGPFVISGIMVGLSFVVPFFSLLAFPVVILFKEHFGFLFYLLFIPKDSIGSCLLFIYYFLILFAVWPKRKLTVTEEQKPVTSAEDSNEKLFIAVVDEPHEQFMIDAYDSYREQSISAFNKQHSKKLIINPIFIILMIIITLAGGIYLYEAGFFYALYNYVLKLHRVVDGNQMH